MEVIEKNQGFSIKIITKTIRSTKIQYGEACLMLPFKCLSNIQLKTNFNFVPNHTEMCSHLILVLASSLPSLLQIAAGGRREEEAVPGPPGAAEGLAEPQPHTGGLRRQYRQGYPLGSSLGLSGAPGPACLSPEEPPASGGKKETVFGLDLCAACLNTI